MFFAPATPEQGQKHNHALILHFQGDYMFDKKKFFGGRNNWCTPQFVFDYFDNKYSFTLDVAADKSNAKTFFYCDVFSDGLKAKWFGRVWCNPPYGRSIGKWVKKAYESSCTSCLLIPAWTDTAWFHDYILGKAKIIFLQGRIAFEGASAPAPFPSMVVIFHDGPPSIDRLSIEDMKEAVLR